MSHAEWAEHYASALNAVSKRAYRSLGDVTLRAILRRLLVVGRDAHPLLAKLTLLPDGVDAPSLVAASASFTLTELHQALGFLLTEFLSLLDSLTAGVLTPALHEELLTTAVSQAARSSGRKAAKDP